MFRKFCLSALLVFSCSLLAQDKPLPNAPSGKSSTIVDYSQEALVFEKFATVFHFENDGKGYRRQTARCRVQSEAALQSLGQLVFAYSSGTEKLKVNYVRVLKADGSVVNAGESAFQDMTTPVAREAPVYSDLREKHITVPALRPGEVVEYEIETEYVEPLAPGQFWMDHSFEKNAIVLNETLEVNIPAGRKLQLKTQPGFDPKISEANGRKVYSWTNQHLAREDKKKKARSRRSRPIALMLRRRLSPAGMSWERGMPG